MIIQIWSEDDVEARWFKIRYTNLVANFDRHIKNIAVSTSWPIYCAYTNSVDSQSSLH